MATAALPWFMIAIYYVFILLPPDYWNSWEAWKENLLLSRFAAPTSEGILFTMLDAIGLKSSWIYKKIQVLAIFDDLDTIILMIPLQIMMIGLRWQLIIVVVIVFMLLAAGWQQLNNTTGVRTGKRSCSIRLSYFWLRRYSISVARSCTERREVSILRCCFRHLYWV